MGRISDEVKFIMKKEEESYLQKKGVEKKNLKGGKLEMKSANFII